MERFSAALQRILWRGCHTSELCSGPQSLYLTPHVTDVDTTLRDADRVFGILRENNPELTGEKRRTIMKPPQVRAWWYFPGACI